MMKEVLYDDVIVVMNGRKTTDHGLSRIIIAGWLAGEQGPL